MAKTRTININAAQYRHLNWHERRRARMGRRTEQLTLKVHPDWKAQLFDIAETVGLRPVGVVERAVELYRKALEKAAGSSAKRKKTRIVTCAQPAP